MTPQASPASAFRRLSKGGETVTLPSGLTVVARPVSLQALVIRGLLPAELFALAMSGFPELEKLQNANKPADLKKLADQLVSIEQWTFIILSEMLISPRMVQKPQTEDEITYDDMVEGDRHWLMALAQTPINQWRPFLQEQGTGVPVGGDGKDVANEAERPAENT